MRAVSFDRYQQSAKYSQLARHKIAYWQAGEGECILLIHGFPSASYDWHHLWPVLKQSHQLLALDLLGFGLSDKPHPHHYSLLEQADIIEALVGDLGISRCHILAHDYGNSVCQELLARAQHNQLSFQLSSVCFLNGGLFAESHRPLFTQKLLKSVIGPLFVSLMNKKKLQQSFNKIFATDTPPKPQDIEVLWKLIQYKQGRKVLPAVLRYIDERRVHRQRWVEAMQQTKCPLYFINGIHDPISGQHMLDRYRQLIPNPKTSALSVGHYPQLESPEQVLKAYLAFLQGIS